MKDQNLYHLKFYLMMAILVISNAAIFASGFTPNASDSLFTGSFVGNIQGVKAEMELIQNEEKLTGKIDASGYIYLVDARIQSNTFKGYLIDEITRGTAPIKAELKNDSLYFSLETTDLEGKQAFVEIVFTPAVATTDKKPSQENEAVVSRDSKLIGGWRHTENYISGEFSTTSEWYLQIFADGTYRYGDGVIGGGSDDYSFYSDDKGDATTGKWKTENMIIYINEGFGWRPYAKYYVEGNSMLFTFSDGTRQLWEKFR